MFEANKALVKVQYLPNYKQIWGKLKYAYATDAGFDLRAAIPADLVLSKDDGIKIPTGVRFEIPEGYEMQIRPRSGLATRGLIILNSPGTIDAGYRGEVHISVMFLVQRQLAPYEQHITINPGMKIAQAILSPITQAVFMDVDALASSERGEGGFGSTGDN
jgi:dUTP pyrophosphatase